MTHQRHHAILLAVALCVLPAITALAHSTTPDKALSPAGYEVTQIAGLTDAKPNARGRLTLSDRELLFSNPEYQVKIPFDHVISVSIGDERIETGGKAGHIVRMVIPYGGGVAAAAVMQKSVDLLTIEYRDLNGGYHGAVFFVPKFSAKALSDRIATQLSGAAPQPPPPCQGAPLNSSSVVVEPIATSGVELPAEYRVLLYEGLFNELGGKATAGSFIRAGSFDAGTGCSAMQLKITVTGFKKGNQALRASTGPIGLFAGKTSVSFHLELTAVAGHQLLAKDMTDSKRMDTDSLGVAKSVAKSVAKKMRKLPAQPSVT